MAKAERSTISLRPSRSDILPQTGAAKAAMNEVIEASNPVQNSTRERLSTPRCGRNNGRTGLRKVNALLMISCTATMAQSVTCHCGDPSNASARAVASPLVTSPESTPIPALSSQGRFGPASRPVKPAQSI